jgi:hypothetical protein
MCAHPLMSLQAVKALARSLQDRGGEIYADVDVRRIEQRWDETSRPRLSPEQLVAEIGAARAWIVIRRADMDPQYKTLLDQALTEIEELNGGALKRLISARNAIIFVTSPGRLTTYHIDRECNFILQIRGNKTVYVFDQNDREVLPDEELERFWTVDNNAAIYKPQFQGRAKAFQLRPGEGVHVPVNAPHWVQNGDDVSVTLSVNFQFKDSSRANQYRANFCLRKLGFQPAPQGRHPLLDNIKGSVMGGIWRIRGPFKSLGQYGRQGQRS